MLKISFKGGVCLWLLAPALAASMLVPAPVSAAVAVDGHWEIVGPKGQEIQADRPYALQNLSNKDLLVYGKQRWGINLRNVKPDAKSNNEPGNIIFSREGSSAGPLTYGERVSVEVMRGKSHGEHLYYTHRDLGPNLGWSKQQKFEWELRGGKCGEKVKTRTPLALYSKIEKDYLVYCARPLSVHLRWLKDKESIGCHGLVKTAAAKIAEKGTQAACTAYGGEGGAAACEAAGVGKRVGKLVGGGGSRTSNTSSLSGCE